MELADVIRSRRMVRRFDAARPVPRDVVRQLLDLATRAPSAGFSQGWRFLVLDTPDDVSRYWASSAPDGPADSWLQNMRSAPVLVVVWCSPAAYEQRYGRDDKLGSTSRSDDRPLSERWPTPYWYVDSAMAAGFLLLAATDASLGSCLFGLPAVAEPSVRAEFEVPDDLKFVATIALGYPAADLVSRPRRKRQPLNDVVSFGSLGPTHELSSDG